jgi:flavin-dependent dehydrogenase
MDAPVLEVPQNVSPKIDGHFDVVVIGGGPAGCTAAAVVAEAGYRTLLLEREPMPRFHVGESLMPDCYWPLERLGLIDRMKQSQFVQKRAVQFVTHDGRESEPFYFSAHDPRECSTTWQVERADFDQLLWRRAGELGAVCRDQTRLLEVEFEGARAIGVRVLDAAGNEQRIASRVVIDGSGQHSFIANRLGLKVPNPDLKKAAIWSYWKDAERDPGDDAGSTVILHTAEKDSWFWFIPQSNNITSIGVVADNDYLLKGRGKPEEVYAEEVANCPGLLPRLSNAEQVAPVRTIKEFSYTTKEHAGEGWVLVGDAFAFVDPIYSSGVYFALESGVRAADAVVEGLRTNDLSAEQLGKWAEEFKAGVHWIRKLVHAFYTKEFSFGQFMRKHPEHRGNLTDLLIGRIFYDGVGRIFDDLDPELAEAKARKAAMIG